MYDIVYTWADICAAYSYSELKQLANSQLGGWLYDHYSSADLLEQRFADDGELRYSLRSLEKYADWFDRIFIVHPDGQYPTWLNTDHPKIYMVSHSEIIPKQYLPTFNSYAIELYLHRIPGISSSFVYSNDDFFFNNYVEPKDFFPETDVGSSIFSRRNTPTGSIDIINSAYHQFDRMKLAVQTGMYSLVLHSKRKFLNQSAVWLGSLATAYRALHQLNSGFTAEKSEEILSDRRIVGHFQYAFHTDALNYIHDKLPEVVHETSSQKFRTPGSLYTPQLTVQVARLLGKFQENKRMIGYYGYGITDQHLGCINAGSTNEKLEFYEKKFAARSCFEKDRFESCHN